MKRKLFIVLFSLVSGISYAQTQYGVWRTPDSNTDYHFLTRNGIGAALYINQISTNTNYPILRLSSGTATANENVKFTVENNGNVGIGTTTPDAKLDLEGNGELLRLTYGNSAGYVEAYKSGVAHWYVGAGSTSTDDVSLSNYKNASLNLLTNGQYRLKVLGNGNVGIGTTTPDYKLDVLGTIRAYEVKVASGWSDFVFEPDYALLTLPEVENYIDQNGHLPDIPSAEEVKVDGISLGEMDAKLLQKIEELTLYVIEQQKELGDLKKENVEIKKENQTIKTDLLKEIETIKTQLK
jgi:hypothetical protein